MKLTRLTRLVSTAVVSTLALSGLSVLAGTTNAFAANGGQTVAAPATGTLTPTAPATYNPGDLNCQGQCVVGPLAGYSVSISATGFDANSGITVAECQGDKTNATFPEPTGSNGPLQCTTFGDDTSGGANISGTFSGTFNIHTVTAAQGGGAATCDATHLCTLYVGENLGDFTAPHALFDFDFAAPLTPNPPSDPSPQALPVANLGSATITINYGTATDSNGGAETINPNSTIVTGPGAGGTVTATSPGVFKYTDTTGVARTDSFVVGGATATCASCTPTTSAAGQNITVNVTVQGAVAYPNSCDVTAQPSCHLKQIVQIPITPGDLVMSQAGDGTNPIVDILDHTTSGTACTGAAVKLDGSDHTACGSISEITVVDATGSDASWNLTGQISDFLDPAAPLTTNCDTTPNSHCIPAANAHWTPTATVVNGASNPTAQVTAGPSAGLGSAAQLCTAPTTHSGGSFHCDAGLTVLVPASTANPASPGYQATLTFTLA